MKQQSLDQYAKDLKERFKKWNNQQPPPKSEPLEPYGVTYQTKSVQIKHIKKSPINDAIEEKIVIEIKNTEDGSPYNKSITIRLVNGVLSQDVH